MVRGLLQRVRRIASRGDGDPGADARGRRRGTWDAVSPLGRSVLALGVASAVGSAVTGWDELAVIAAACVVAVLVGVAFLLAGRHQLVVAVELVTPRVVVGDTAATAVSATNAANRRMLPVRLETVVGRGVSHLRVPSLAAGETHDEALLIPTTRRSVLPVGPVRSVQGDPLGLVRREVQWAGRQDLYVHPRTVPIRSLTSGFVRDLEGQTTNDRSPSDVAFHTLREYVVGDDRRHIHWRTTARQPDGKLMVREFVDTRRAHVGIVVSTRTDDYADAEEFELAVSIAGSIALRALADEQELTCIVGHHMMPSSSPASLLDGLAGAERTAGPDLPVVVARARDRLAAASVVVTITGSAADPASSRRAMDHLGASVKAFGCRVQVGAEAAVAATAGAPVLTVGALDDLPRALWAVTG